MYILRRENLKNDFYLIKIWKHSWETDLHSRNLVMQYSISPAEVFDFIQILHQ